MVQEQLRRAAPRYVRCLTAEIQRLCTHAMTANLTKTSTTHPSIVLHSLSLFVFAAHFNLRRHVTFTFINLHRTIINNNVITTLCNYQQTLHEIRLSNVVKIIVNSFFIPNQQIIQLHLILKPISLHNIFKFSFDHVLYHI